MLDRPDYQDLAHRYGEIAERIGIGDKSYEFIVRTLAQLLPASGESACLVAGCGNGDLERHLLRSERFRGLSISAFDLSARSVETARAACPQVEYSVQHLPTLNYADGQFQLVICSEVLEHVAEPKASLVSLGRVLSDDGYLVVTVPNGDRFGFERYLRQREVFQPADDFFYTFAEAQQLFRQAGLRIRDYAGWDGFVPVNKSDSYWRRRWLRLLNALLRLHPDAARRQKRILYLLRKDPYLLHHDF